MASRPRSSSDPLSPQLLAALRSQLAQGERLAWAARHEPAAFKPKKRAKRKWDAAVILGGGYLTLGAVVMAVRSEQWLWLSVPIALLLLGGGAFFVVTRTRARAQKVLDGVVYAVTTQRALIMHSYPELNLQARSLTEITDVAVSNKDVRGDFADLELGQPALVFRGVPEPERARAQLLRVIRDPQTTDQEIAAAEAYAATMRQFMARPSPR